MPTNIKRADLEADVKALQDTAFASNYGLSRDFIDKNSKIVFNANKAVSDTLLGYGVDNLTRSTNSIQDLANLVRQSQKFSNKKDAANALGNGDVYSDPVTGIKSITPIGNIDATENQVISDNAMMYQSFLNTTAEYRGVVDIIPEVAHAIQNIVRDILNVSELTGRALNNVYTDDVNVTSSEESKKETIRCNKLIQDEIIDKNHLEEKEERWIYESVVCGAKPVAFIPYDYIIRQVKNVAKNSDFKVDVESISAKSKAGESFTVCKTDKDRETFYKNSVESCFEDMIDKNKISSESAIESVANNEYDKLFSDEFVDQYASIYENEFKSIDGFIANKELEVQDEINRSAMLTGSKSTEATEQLEILDAFKKKHDANKKTLNKLSEDDKKREARAGIRTLARWIDSNIDVVKPGASSALIADKVMSQKDRYSKFYDLGDNYLLAEGVKNKTDALTNQNDGNSSRSDSSPIGFDNSSTLGKECLIVPYAPESVIPINVNGEYMGFYCMEYEHITGPQWRNRKRAGSFTDYVQQQGYGNDSNFLGGNAPMAAYGGSDPLENNLYSPLSLYNYSVSQYMYGGMDQEDQRFDMMKTVVLRVLAHRLRDPDLVDNKAFKDAVMHMMRNDVLTKTKVQFTFLPPEFMCYMTYKTDDDGLPKSILDGTLFFAYLYISSVVSSGMIKLLKSSDKEVYEVNVGLQKNIGYSIEELQRTLSTRSLFTQSMFGNLSSVIKSAGSYSRLIIPVVQGEKLYNVTQLERQNNLDPDDDYTKNLLQSILSKIYINSGAASAMDDVDFAKQLSMRNIEYRTNIVKGQANYVPYITKQLKLLTNYSALSVYNSKAELINTDANETPEDKKKRERDHKNGIDISRIAVKLSAPTMLSMSNIIEVVDAAKNMSDDIMSVYNLDAGTSAVETARNTLFKKKLIQKYATIVEWDDLDKMLDDATQEAPAYVAKSLKLTKADEKINNPEDEGGDSGGGIGDTGDTGGGGDDMGGGSPF